MGEGRVPPWRRCADERPEPSASHRARGAGLAGGRHAGEQLAAAGARPPRSRHSLQPAQGPGAPLPGQRLPVAPQHGHRHPAGGPPGAGDGPEPAAQRPGFAHDLPDLSDPEDRLSAHHHAVPGDRRYLQTVHHLPDPFLPDPGRGARRLPGRQAGTGPIGTLAWRAQAGPAALCVSSRPPCPLFLPRSG